ncbi:DegT/DnrJ/EryC1/StrS family aminotransferase, partial [Anaerovibrio sp.]|uniref:DegT/DnrJ/EryC1/StrS family aminotransferase n=1 Tax=Anaerovibrio sp. TaxID=1872532 RepID=UPI0025BFE49C
LRKKLIHLDTFIKQRRRNAATYNAALSDTSYITPHEAAYSEHAYYIYALKHSAAQSIIKKLQGAGVSCGTYYPVPLHLQGAFAKLGYRKGDLPVTEELSRTTFAIPVFPEMYAEERDFVISKLKYAVGEEKKE